MESQINRLIRETLEKFRVFENGRLCIDEVVIDGLNIIGALKKAFEDNKELEKNLVTNSLKKQMTFKIEYNDFGVMYIIANSFSDAEKKFNDRWSSLHGQDVEYMKSISYVGDGLA
jgi:hypothetical protein